MRSLWLLMLLACLAPVCGAEVIRCAGNNTSPSYTDGACPPGTRQVGSVPVPESAPLPPPARASASGMASGDAGRAADVARQPQGASPPPAQAQWQAPPPVPSGPIIIDSRGTGNAGSPPDADPRWSDRGNDVTIMDERFGYPPGAYRGRPLPPADMRPRIRRCDGAGCDDTLGNRYDRNGQLDRYRAIDGRTCQPVGTTTICR